MQTNQHKRTCRANILESSSVKGVSFKPIEYARNLRSELNNWRNHFGGEGDVLIAVLTKHNSHSFVRVLFSPIGDVTHAPDDEEWDYCLRWLEKVSLQTNKPVRVGRMVMAGDLCVLVKDTEDASMWDETAAHLDAAAIIDALCLLADDQGVAA
jgi:hypothetical protein